VRKDARGSFLPMSRNWLAILRSAGVIFGSSAGAVLVRLAGGLLASTDAVPGARAPLVVERGGRRLAVRFVSEPTGRTLLLEERGAVPSAATLEALGLTRREAQVLVWVREGKTNAEIGAIVDARPRTVAKHLERIFQKLGVETRTAAAKIAGGAGLNDSA